MSEGSQGASNSVRAVRGATWIGLGSIFEYGVTFLTMVVLARLIPPAEFGAASIAISLLSFARLFSDIAMGPALIRHERVDERHINVAFISVMLVAILAATVTVLASPAIARFFGTPELRKMCWAVALLTPIHATISIVTALLSRRALFRFIALSTLPGMVIGYAGTSIYLAANGFGAWSILFGAIVQNSISVVIMFIRTGFVPRFSWSRGAFHELLSFSVGQSLSQLANQVALSGDNFVVGRFLGMGPVGLYNRAYKLMELPVAIISTTLFKVSFPLMSSIQSHEERLSTAYLSSLRGLVTILIPLSVFLIFSANPLILLILGPQWHGAVMPFQILCASLTFRAAYRHVNLPMLVLGNTYRLTLLSTLYAVCVISGAIVAVAIGGTIVHVAIAVSIAILIHYVVSGWSTNHLLRISPARFAKLHAPGAFIGISLAIILQCARIASPWLERSAPAALATNAALSMGASAMLIYWWPRWFLGVQNLLLLARVAHCMPLGRSRFTTWITNATR